MYFKSALGFFRRFRSSLLFKLDQNKIGWSIDDWLIDWLMVFYAVSAVFQLNNGGRMVWTLHSFKREYTKAAKIGSAGFLEGNLYEILKGLIWKIILICHRNVIKRQILNAFRTFWFTCWLKEFIKVYTLQIWERKNETFLFSFNVSTIETGQDTKCTYMYMKNSTSNYFSINRTLINDLVKLIWRHDSI